MVFDFHSHSTASDGVLSPAGLAARAAGNGVGLWALTDHDALAGLAEARESAASAGMGFVDGVEVSVTWRGQTVHVVGLGIDPAHPAIAGGVAATRSSRYGRAERIADELARAGIAGALDGALAHAESKELVGRTHFARYIVERGFADDVSAVFDRYLSPGRPGYVPHEWAKLDDAVRWIRESGGAAVIAHPGRYDLSARALDALLGEFKRSGGVGIEVVTGSHSPDQFTLFAQIAKQYGFLASCGSDFHSPDEGGFDLGCLPPLPPGVTSILEVLA